MAWRKEKMTLFVANTRAKGFKNFLVFSNDSVIITYLSTYFYQFKTKNIEKIRVKYGLKERQQQINCLVDILRSGKSRALLKTHILPGCDFMSKIIINPEPEKILFDCSSF